MESWQHIYSILDPIAFSIGPFNIHWYGIMYALALISAIYLGYYVIKKYDFNITKDEFDTYVLWAEIGVILGARLGYILFYDTHTSYYLLHPWQIFNPFVNGVFVGISGMSYHGAFIGFVIATYLYCKKYNKSFWNLVDIAALSVPLGYIFGRIGNFLNHELIGNVTDVSWGVYVGYTLRHPSQLYEAFLEGFVILVILHLYKKRQKFAGELGFLYAILYSLMRIISEFFRAPDVQIGYLFGTNWITMGMVLSFVIFLILLVIYLLKLSKINKNLKNY